MRNDLKRVIIYSDGACSQTFGGWSSILIYNTSIKIIKGHEPDTTNNRMELSGVLKGLEALKEPCDVIVYCDSKYVVNAIDKRWLEKWVSTGWILTTSEPVKNQDLWELIIIQLNRHKVKMEWVKGHANNYWNNEADKYATEQVSYIKSVIDKN